MKEVTIDKRKISLMSNYIIFVMVIIATIIMFTGFKISFIKEPILETSGLGLFKFFTVDSNVLMGISAILFAHQERKLINGKIKEIPVGYYILKFIATVSVGLTFVVVFGYLGKLPKRGLISLLQNSNIFYHLLIPVLSMLTFILFEKTKKIKLSYVVCGLIPVLLYGIYYVINIINHIEDGKVLPKYDWYYFLYNGFNSIYKVVPMIFGLTLVISLILWFFNRKGK